MQRKKFEKKERKWEREQLKNIFPRWRKDSSLKMERKYQRQNWNIRKKTYIDTYYTEVQNKKHRIS